MNTIKNMDCIAGMKELPDNSIDCCVTSPPYFGLRTYLPGVVKIKDDAPEWVIIELKKRGIVPLKYNNTSILLQNNNMEDEKQ